MTRNLTRNFYQLDTENDLPMYDEYEADAWRQAIPQQGRKKETKDDRSGPKGLPEDVWMVNRLMFFNLLKLYRLNFKFKDSPKRSSG